MNARLLQIATVLFCAAIAPAARAAEDSGTESQSPIRATWYGGKYHGKTTANGEKFNVKEFTAAHPTLPFDSVVEVKQVKGKRKVLVRINDRCGGCEIDLSPAAARRLGILWRGHAPVKLDVLAQLVRFE